MDLPDEESADRSCVAKVNQTHYILLGGYYMSNKVQIFNSIEEKWVDLTSMDSSVFSAGCAVVRDEDGRQNLIVVGGYG